MKIVKKLLVVGAAGLLASCSSSQVAVKKTSSVSKASSSEEGRLAAEVHKEVNRYRASKGLNELKFHNGLSKLAKTHSNYMKTHAGSFSVDGQKNLITHYGFDARCTLASKKYRIESLSENVIASYKMGQGTDLGGKMVRGWLTSPNHRHNLNAKWSQTGIAVTFDDQGRAFVTQLFGSAPSNLLPVGGPMRDRW